MPPSQHSRLTGPSALSDSQAESVFLTFRALMEGDAGAEKGNVGWAEACKLAGVPFSAFIFAFNTDFEPGGVRERCEMLRQEAMEVVKGMVMGQAIHGKSLSAAKILLGNGVQVNVNVNNGGEEKSKLQIEMQKKKEKSLAQIPDKEAREFIERNREIVDAEVVDG